MTDIYYETDEGETLHIDEVSQRLLVYLLIHGRTNLDDAVDPVGAKGKSDLKRRFQEPLGPESVEFVVGEKSSQTTLGDQPAIRYRQLIERGKEFVYDHRERLAMPADLTELAREVADLRVQQSEAGNIDDRLSRIEERLYEIEEQLGDSSW
jgi:hypothetical protein